MGTKVNKGVEVKMWKSVKRVEKISPLIMMLLSSKFKKRKFVNKNPLCSKKSIRFKKMIL